MRLLDRYLLRELLIPLSYCLSGFLIFWISFDLFSELADFQKEKMSFLEVAHFYVITAPELLVVVMPIALLLALLYSLTNHARHNELTAIRAAGVSMVRICLPYLGVGLLFSGFLFALNEFWVPKSYDAAKELRSRRLAEAGESGRWEHNLNFRNARDGRIWNIQAFNLDTFEMRAPQITWSGDAGMRRSLIATNAIWTNGSWTFQDAQEFNYPSVEEEASAVQDGSHSEEATRTPVLTIPELSETPEHIKSEVKVKSLQDLKAARKIQLSIAEILSYLRLHPDLNPRFNAMLHTRLHERIATPWTCLVVVLIAIPFGAPSGRRNVFAGVAMSIFICFAFFVLTRFCLALGAGGHLPPWLAAWLPNIVFAATGLALIRRMR